MPVVLRVGTGPPAAPAGRVEEGLELRRPPSESRPQGGRSWGMPVPLVSPRRTRPGAVQGSRRSGSGHDGRCGRPDSACACGSEPREYAPHALWNGSVLPIIRHDRKENEVRTPHSRAAVSIIERHCNNSLPLSFIYEMDMCRPGPTYASAWDIGQCFGNISLCPESEIAVVRRLGPNRAVY